MNPWYVQKRDGAFQDTLDHAELEFIEKINIRQNFNGHTIYSACKRIYVKYY